MCQFVLTIEDADASLTPGRPIATTLRAVAAIIETQLPPAATGELHDPRNGNQLCSWTYGEPPELPVEPTGTQGTRRG